jgi:hypothetical protein
VKGMKGSPPSAHARDLGGERSCYFLLLAFFAGAFVSVFAGASAGS